MTIYEQLGDYFPCHHVTPPCLSSPLACRFQHAPPHPGFSSLHIDRLQYNTIQYHFWYLEYLVAWSTNSAVIIIAYYLRNWIWYSLIHITIFQSLTYKSQGYNRFYNNYSVVHSDQILCSVTEYFIIFVVEVLTSFIYSTVSPSSANSFSVHQSCSASIFKIKISHFCHQNFSKFLRLYMLFPWKFLEISWSSLQWFCSNTKDLINFQGTK
jgi:hypothetical protein